MSINIKDNIQELRISDITPHDGSHKTDDNLNLIMESIKEYGVNQPISVDKNYVVVTGNGVFKAAKALGYETIPCIVLDDLSDEQIEQYRIADDKTSEFSRWNEKKLRQELSYLQDPMSVQTYFDESVFSMLGLDSKPKAVKTTNDVVTKVSIEEIKTKKIEEDNRFKQHLKEVENSMVIKPAEYFEYNCSKCGRLVKIKV